MANATNAGRGQVGCPVVSRAWANSRVRARPGKTCELYLAPLPTRCGAHTVNADIHPASDLVPRIRLLSAAVLETECLRAQGRRSWMCADLLRRVCFRGSASLLASSTGRHSSWNSKILAKAVEDCEVVDQDGW